jgi:hypothetical protein
MAQGGGKPSFVVPKWVEMNETKPIAEIKALRFKMVGKAKHSPRCRQRNKIICRKLFLKELQALDYSLGACLQR